MAFNLGGGYGAGAGADMLQQILRQKALESAEAERQRINREELAARTREAEARRMQDERQMQIQQEQFKTTQSRLDKADEARREDMIRTDFVSRVLPTLRGGTVLSPEVAASLMKYAPERAEKEMSAAMPNPEDYGPAIPHETGKVKVTKSLAEQTGEDTREMREAIAAAQRDAADARQQASLSAMQGRSANVPVIITTTDADGRPITRVMPRSEAMGQTFGAAPTAEQRNRVAARGTGAPVLKSIGELSERINTGQGVVAKITGAVEKAKAQANLNDDIAEYEAVVSGFTPLLARMVGHTGVLTEQDVQSVRQMLPSPMDSKSVRDRKMARIETIMGGMPGAQTTQPGQKPPAQNNDPLGIR